MAAYAGTYHARLGKMIDATPPVIWTLSLGATQTFVAGEFVYRSGGYVVTCADSPTMVLGLALEAATSGDAGAYEVKVLIATAMTAFKIPVHHTTPANAVIEITDKGKLGSSSFDLAHVAGTGVWYIAKHLTTADDVTIQQFIDPLATLNGKVLATINYAIREVA